MKRRWIIRSFFVGLVLLFGAMWVASYVEATGATYQASGFGALYPDHGVLFLQHTENTALPKGFSIFHRAMLPGERSGPFLGFTWVDSGPFPWLNLDAQQSFGVPLWFPTILTAAALGLVWRKTRPPVKGRAFPVEAGAADGGKMRA